MMVIMNDVAAEESTAAESLAVLARQSLSDYCRDECGAYCCRIGYLLLSASQVGLMRNVDIATLKLMPIRFEADEKRYIFSLGLDRKGCPNLDDGQCSIHKNPDRPDACKKYPLFIGENKTVIITDECPGVRENKLFSYLAEFKAMGYNLVYFDEKEKKEKKLP